MKLTSGWGKLTHHCLCSCVTFRYRASWFACVLIRKTLYRFLGWRSSFCRIWHCCQPHSSLCSHWLWQDYGSPDNLITRPIICIDECQVWNTFISGSPGFRNLNPLLSKCTSHSEIVKNDKLGLGRGLWMVPCLLPTCCWDKYQSFFAPSQQPFPCMADSLHGSGHCAVWILWRISATSLRQLFLDEVNQDSRVQHPPKCRCLGENAFQHRWQFTIL